MVYMTAGVCMCSSTECSVYLYICNKRKDLFICLEQYILMPSLLCTIDSCNGIQMCHLQCRSLSYNAAVVSWIESIVSLTQ